MPITQNMLNAMAKNKIEVVTTVPCKQLSGIIELLENEERILHIVSKCESGNIPVPVIGIDPAVIRHRFTKEVEARN